MLTAKEETKISKFLSLVLRHAPETISIQLDAQGWTSVDELILKAQKAGVALDSDKLKQVVANNEKKRFAFNADLSQIRARQGHSVQVDLGYKPLKPPQYLYHGTVAKAIPAIKEKGLNRMSRHHVHLSADTTTANVVGQRRGKPIILVVEAEKMHEDGYSFFVTENGVWLTDEVPPKYIILPNIADN